ncbi:MAG: PilZ domain-containing protein [Candidatus Solibacter usitatus]|nr:PilZ domain-containing protein [Candidatus Solibacter usitatus]
MADQRKHTRTPTAGDVDVQWNDSAGNSFRLTGAWSDLSESGGGFQLSRHIKVGAQVRIDSPSFGISGLAIVRNCTPQKGLFRVGVEFLEGLDCPYCGARLGPGVHRCPRCRNTPLKPKLCALCGLAGHPKDVSCYLTNGFPPADTPAHMGWSAHISCLDALRMAILRPCSSLRCLQCRAPVEFSSLHALTPGQLLPCRRCSASPATLQAAWGPRPFSCSICDLAIYQQVHETWPGCDEASWRSGDAAFLHAVHLPCALRLGFKH